MAASIAGSFMKYCDVRLTVSKYFSRYNWSMEKKGNYLLNRYRIIKTIEGGMGVVYLCLDEDNDNIPLALKTYKSPPIANNKIKEAFLREVSLWIEIGYHPNIVKAYSVEVLPDTQEIFLGMELVPTFPGKENASLRSWLTNLPLNLDWILRVSSGIIHGMLFATEKIQGLVHRDLKPENVLIGIDQNSKITDFGLARYVVESIEKGVYSHNNSRKFTDNTAGTPLYKSPEQWRNEHIDHRTDMYAFGCIMLEMLTGNYAIHGNSLEELKNNHINGMAHQVAQSSNLPTPLMLFLQKCTHPELQERFITWKKLREEFNNITEVLLKKHFIQPEVPVDVSMEGQIASGSSYIAIAQTYLTLSDSENANKYFNKALNIGKSQRYSLLLSIAISGLGIAHFINGDYEKAIDHYQAASDINLEIEDEAIYANNKINISNAYFIKGNFEASKKYALEAISIAERIGELETQVQYTYTLANILSASRDYINALEQYKTSLRIIGENRDHILIGGIQLGMGTTYFQLGQFEYAFQHFQGSLKYSLQKGNDGLKVNSLIGIAKTLISQNENNEAWIYLEKAIKLIESLSEKHQIAQLNSDIGALLNTLGKPKDAIPYLSYAINLSQDLGLQLIKARSLFSLGMAYELTSDMPNAIKNIKKSVDLFKVLNMPEYHIISKHLNDLVEALKTR